jgi:hypothetical protein
MLLDLVPFYVMNLVYKFYFIIKFKEVSSEKVNKMMKY